MVICLEPDADLHTAQLMPLPLTVSCCSKIQIGFTFLVPADLGSHGQRAVKRVCVCVCVCGPSVGAGVDAYMMLHWLAGYTHRFTAAERISVPHGVTFTAAGLASDA